MESIFTITATDKEMQFIYDNITVKLCECLDNAPQEGMNFSDDTSRRWKLMVRHPEEMGHIRPCTAQNLIMMFKEQIKREIQYRKKKGLTATSDRFIPSFDQHLK